MNALNKTCLLVCTVAGLTACTTEPTRAEHEALIADLRSQLAVQAAANSVPREVTGPSSPEMPTRACAEQDAAAPTHPKSFEEYEAQHPDPVGALFNKWDAETAATERGEALMYQAFRDYLVDACTQAGCGFHMPNESTLRMRVIDLRRADGN